MQLLVAQDTDQGVNIGYHVWHSHDLTDIVATPSTFDEVFPTQWNTALPAQARNAFTFEPYGEPGMTDTIGTETAAFESLVASVAGGPTTSPKYYVFEGWPATSDYAAYQTYWNASVIDADGTPMRQQRGMFSAVYERLQTAVGANVWVAPIGDVFNAIDVAARAGSITGATTVASFYRDGTHMGQAGQFAAACTIIATQLRQPCGTSATTVAAYLAAKPNGTSTVTFNLALAQQLSTLVWSVVSTDPRAIH